MKNRRCSTAAGTAENFPIQARRLIPFKLLKIKAIKVAKDQAYALRQFKDQPIFWFVFPDRAHMGLMFERISMYAEEGFKLVSEKTWT